MAGCSRPVHNDNAILEKIKNSMHDGDLKTAISIAGSLKSITANEKVRWKADSLIQISERILVDFPLTENDVRDRLQKSLGERYNPDDIKIWESNGWLEYRIINGEKRFFSRAASNLLLLRIFSRTGQKVIRLPHMMLRLVFRKNHSERIISALQKGKCSRRTCLHGSCLYPDS